ncbi:MAG: hypothetical protein M4D80_23370 [Myxococcota bacterium]|nr:hypothetical protein [Deltaproteobacteria bacterium]MDQ3338117.1 hypothetical protein [Myxococcota bacterium]
MKSILLSLVTLVVLSGVADAYPQFQLMRDQTCTGCHLSPAGGNLLNENGYAVAEAMSQFGTAPEFMYGAIPTPSWLVLGGDLRGAAGYLKTPENVVAAFPMQIELYAAAKFKAFSLHVNFGPRPPTVGNENATRVWAREHYLMWQLGDSDGLYVRAGRFMPVFGLRLAEHTVYTRRYGGTALFADTYGLAFEFVHQRFEAHVTGFIKDPVIDSVEHYSGGAAYFEFRPKEWLALGAEAMAEVGIDDKRFRGGVTAKVVLPGELLLQGEFQFVNQLVDSPDGRGAPKSLVGYVMASRMLNDFLMVDLGFGHYDPSIRIGENERTGVDVNVHYFTTSHLELVLNTRYEAIGLGKGGDPGAYAIMQLHYRL